VGAVIIWSTNLARNYFQVHALPRLYGEVAAFAQILEHEGIASPLLDVLPADLGVIARSRAYHPFFELLLVLSSTIVLRQGQGWFYALFSV
jgi:hypothetical protein